MRHAIRTGLCDGVVYAQLLGFIKLEFDRFVVEEAEIVLGELSAPPMD